ncbi:MAG TPA: hypothetical protein VGL09_02795 [Methylomirabilota bacterium]|jgi:hypothetical protein
MPRVLLVGSGSRAMFYVVDRPVGRNAPNDRLDVLLVQYMLRIVTDKFASTGAIGAPVGNVAPTGGLRVATLAPSSPAPSTAPPSYTLPGGSPIIIDGICGNQTIGFIESVQKHWGLPINGQVSTPTDRTNQTLSKLCAAFVPLNAPIYSDLSKDPAFPGDLRTLFYVYYGFGADF